MSNHKNVVIPNFFLIQFDKDRCLPFFSTWILAGYQSFNQDEKRMCEMWRNMEQESWKEDKDEEKKKDINNIRNNLYKFN